MKRINHFQNAASKSVLLLTLGFLCLLSSPTNAAEKSFPLTLRSRYESQAGSRKFHIVYKKEHWNAKQTAVIVCDMWDLHHCLNASRRVGELAPRINQFLKLARQQGATIIHSPSSCMKFYENHPARKNAQNIPKAANMPAKIGSWCHIIPAEEKGVYPIDQSDGGLDDDLKEFESWQKVLKSIGRNPGAPWKRENELLEIKDADFISDIGQEVWSILEHRGIKNVLLVGVHTNMCVLGRPFGLRQMVKNGKNVALVRDLTDTMYNPKMKPFVSHFTGTDLIVEHIEKWICPTVTSNQFLGGVPFRFRNDRRKRLVIISAEREYKTERSLPKFALKNLGDDFRVDILYADENDRYSIPGIEILNKADVLLLSVRRRVLPKDQMKIIHRFVESGKPVVGIRTSCHAFSLRGRRPPKGYIAWEKFDAEIIGGHYTDHHGNGPEVTVRAAADGRQHPILSEIDPKKLHGHGSLYRVSPLAKSAIPLLIGKREGKPEEPIAWVNLTRYGGRVFYTSLGHIDDFKQPAFNRLLKNALLWSVHRLEKKSATVDTSTAATQKTGGTP